MAWSMDSDRPIYAQLVERIQVQIVSGYYPAGAKLPSVRELAGIAAVNPNTMQKAFAELERSGLILTQRTNGRTVTEDQELIEKIRRDLAGQHIENFAVKMKELGFTKEQPFFIEKWLLFSKSLVAGLWYLFVALSIMVSVGILVASMIVSTTGSAVLWKEIGETIGEMRYALNAQARLSLIHVCVSLILMMLITPFSGVLMLFGSITIGQLSRKYKALMGILAYFGVMFVNMIVTYILQLVFTLGTLLTTSEATGTSAAGTYDSAVLVAIIMGTAMYFVSHYILTKKLNMD